MSDDILDPSKEITEPNFSDGDGVAICASWTNFGANKMGASAIMMKSGTGKLEMDLRKAYRHVRVTLSFEEFLEKFFGMWGTDAKVLASVLGYEVEESEYDQDYYQAKIDKAEEAVELLKANKTEEDLYKLSNKEQDIITALQVKFEKGLQTGATFSGSNKEELNKSSVVDDTIKQNSENGENEDMSDQITELTKAFEAKLEEQRLAFEAEKNVGKIEAELNKAADIELFDKEAKDLIKGKDLETVTQVVGLMVKAQATIKELEDKVVALEKKASEAEETFMEKSLTTEGEGKEPEGFDPVDHMKNLAKAYAKA